MTALLQQAIEVLQMSRLELHELVQGALRRNPFLEESTAADAADMPATTGRALPTSPEPEPRPANSPSDPRSIIPDVVVSRVGAEYLVTLNEDGLPRLRLSPRDRRVSRSMDHDTGRYVDDELRSAVWLIKSIDQRQRTLGRITTSVVAFQREFFDHGLDSLGPLSLHDVGEDLGMRESTIGRVITNKHVQTPHGLFPLELFFPPHRLGSR